MENVAEMKNGFDQAYSNEIIERLNNAGYVVAHNVLNAADFGVPQRRRRAFFLASYGKKEISFPTPTFFSPENGYQSGFFPSHVTVWDAIGDLPPLKHGEGKDPCPYTMAPFTKYQETMRSYSETVRNHVARKLAPTQYERLAALMPGQGLKDLPPELQTKGGYSGAYGRLTKDMIAPTITRWVFHPGSGRWGHPTDIRILTIREVARIQSFPDTFVFAGSYNDQAGQLGNAVPPLLAEKIARTIRSQTSS